VVVAPHGGEDLTVAIFAVSLTGLVAVRQLAALRDNNRLLGTVDANLRQLQDVQQELAHQVSHDPLTEIGNRAMFTAQLTARLGAGSAGTSSPCCYGDGPNGRRRRCSRI
jgi:PleD family two-component response regulator